jgi:hypothetical protein
MRQRLLPQSGPQRSVLQSLRTGGGQSPQGPTGQAFDGEGVHMGTRQIGVRADVTATLTYTGSDQGSSQNESRTITACQVQNDSAVAVELDVESETTKLHFGGVVAAGQTDVITVLALAQRWNTARFGGLWDGLNIRWRIPA